MVALVEPTLMRMEPQAVPGSALSLAAVAVAVPHTQAAVRVAAAAAVMAAQVPPMPVLLPPAAAAVVEGDPTVPVVPVAAAQSLSDGRLANGPLR